MQGGTAGTWADNHTNTILDPNPEVVNPFTTFEEFQTTFERAFGAADRAQKARTDMAALKMKPGDTVEEYTTAFESLAGYTEYNEPAHIEAYRAGLNSRIVEKIYSDTNGQLPADLHAWKTKARNLDNLHLELKALQRSSPGVSQVARPRQFQVRTPAVPAAQAPPTPAAAPASDAMDVDGGRRNVRCYNCGKFGHIAKFCAEPRKYRSVRAAEIAEVVRSVLAEKSVKEEEVVAEGKADFLGNQQ
jgi:Retrotransposon gag protein/Zinc knuckle